MTTHKQLDIIGLNLRNMPHLELGHFVVGLADAFAAHPDYQAPGAIPPPLPQPDVLRQFGVNHINATRAAEGCDRYKVAERDALRPTTELYPTMMVQWAVIRSVSENNPALIANLGLQPKIQSVRSSVPATVTAPQKVTAKHGKGPGTALINTGKVPRSLTYDVGICQGDPSSEESWSTVGPFDHCRNMELTGLEPGKVYYFRVRCFGAGGLSPWSAIVNLRVL
jgi:hypothetical protein